MKKSSLVTLALAAVLSLGALSIASAAQAPGHGNGGGGPVGGGSPPGPSPHADGDDVLDVILAQTTDCDANGNGCVILPPKPKHPRPVIRIVRSSIPRCVDVAHPHYITADNQVMIDQTKSKIPFCDDMHTLQ